MKCPECLAKGERSQVFEHGTFSTLMAFSAYFDEDGNRHVHDPNSHTASYSCSNGHKWGESQRAKCPSCDFGGVKP